MIGNRYRRLDRVPAAHRAWLRLAAVMGREIDLAALRSAVPRLEEALNDCARVAVVAHCGRFGPPRMRRRHPPRSE